MMRTYVKPVSVQMPLCLQENIAVSGVPDTPSVTQRAETPYIPAIEELITNGDAPDLPDVPDPVPLVTLGPLPGEEDIPQ